MSTYESITWARMPELRISNLSLPISYLQKMRALRLATRSYRTLQLPFHSPKCFLNKQLVHRAYFHSDDSFTASNRIKGEVLDYAVDLRNSRPGDIINIPYEITISEATQVRFLSNSAPGKNIGK
jgi:hypothetical protein